MSSNYLSKCLTGLKPQNVREDKNLYRRGLGAHRRQSIVSNGFQMLHTFNCCIFWQSSVILGSSYWFQSAGPPPKYVFSEQEKENFWDHWARSFPLLSLQEILLQLPELYYSESNIPGIRTRRCEYKCQCLCRCKYCCGRDPFFFLSQKTVRICTTPHTVARIISAESVPLDTC